MVTSPIPPLGLSLGAIAAAIQGENLSAQNVVETTIATIADDPFNTFVHIDMDGAMASAEAVDRALAAGENPGPLAGVPFAVKDLEDCQGMPTRFGSLLFEDAPPASGDSPLVHRLRRAGAIPVGKTAASEFGFDSATATRIHGTTSNPWNPERTPGGSSGGSAAAIAAGLVPLATASDGGGSIREPAAFCGLVGLKPTHGLIPRARSSMFSTPGVFTRTVTELAMVLDTVHGPDPRDRWSLPTFERRFSDLLVCPRRLRARFSADLGYALVEPEIISACRRAAEQLAEMTGLDLDDTRVALPDARPAWLTLGCADLAHELKLLGPWPETLNKLCPQTAAAARAGAQVSAEEYVSALATCRDIEADLAALFGETDLLITPATACLPFAAEGPIPTTIAGRDAGICAAEPFGPLANVTGLPAISIPAGISKSGLPIGLQLLTRRNEEHLLLALAAMSEPDGGHPLPGMDRAHSKAGIE